MNHRRTLSMCRVMARLLVLVVVRMGLCLIIALAWSSAGSDHSDNLARGGTTIPSDRAPSTSIGVPITRHSNISSYGIGVAITGHVAS